MSGLGLLPDRPRRRLAEPVVPMINVGFLLLIFFLIAAQIAPSAPFPVTPPEGAAETAEVRSILFVGSDGALAFGGLRDEAAFAAASAEGSLQISADRALDGAALAALLTRLAGAGVIDIQLTVARR